MHVCLDMVCVCAFSCLCWGVFGVGRGYKMERLGLVRQPPSQSHRPTLDRRSEDARSFSSCPDVVFPISLAFPLFLSHSLPFSFTPHSFLLLMASPFISFLPDHVLMSPSSLLVFRVRSLSLGHCSLTCELQEVWLNPVKAGWLQLMRR